VATKAYPLSGPSQDEAFRSSALDLMNKIATAAKVVCAEGAGFNSWDAFEKAE
jgi:hypothetical protein